MLLSPLEKRILFMVLQLLNHKLTIKDTAYNRYLHYIKIIS